MNRRGRFGVVNEILAGAALLSVTAFHAYILYLVARGGARSDGFAPHVGGRGGDYVAADSEPATGVTVASAAA